MLIVIIGDVEFIQDSIQLSSKGNGKANEHSVDLEAGQTSASDPSKDPAMAKFFEEVCSAFMILQSPIF